MLAFLIVEDQPNVLKLLRDYLASEFPGAAIHTAETVREAIDRMELSRKADIQYKVGIFDFKLPTEKGEHPEIDTTMRRRFLGCSARNAVVFHITAYPDDPKIREFVLEEQLKDPQSARPLVVSKLEVNWTEKLYEAIRKFIHGEQIAERLNRVFPFSKARYRGAMESRSETRPPSSLTHELAALARDIEAHWDDLNDNLKNRIRELMVVQEGEKVTVTLF